VTAQPTTPPRARSARSALAALAAPVAAAAALLAGAVTIAVPGTWFTGLLVTPLLVAVAAALWLVAVVGALRARGRRPVRLLPLLALPLAVLAGLVLVATELPLRAQLAVARADLDAVADRAAAGDDTPARSGLIDLVPQGRDAQGCDVVAVPQGGFFDPVGFARCPVPPADIDPDTGTYRPLADDWYAWERRF
jgi:hypothetical protein